MPSDWANQPVGCTERAGYSESWVVVCDESDYCGQGHEGSEGPKHNRSGGPLIIK